MENTRSKVKLNSFFVIRDLVSSDVLLTYQGQLAIPDAPELLYLRRTGQQGSQVRWDGTIPSSQQSMLTNAVTCPTTRVAGNLTRSWLSADAQSPNPTAGCKDIVLWGGGRKQNAPKKKKKIHESLTNCLWHFI